MIEKCTRERVCDSMFQALRQDGLVGLRLYYAMDYDANTEDRSRFIISYYRDGSQSVAFDFCPFCGVHINQFHAKE